MANSEGRQFQEMAIEVARSSFQDKEPHLYVGAVIVKDGNVIATGYRGQHNPGDHAEYTALEKELKARGQTAANCTVYATLEPCTIRGPGKTSCATRLIEHRVKRVVIGAIDPNVDIRGSGIKSLQGAGIEVHLFDHDLMNEIYALNREFEQYHTTVNASKYRVPLVSSMSLGETPEDAVLEHLRLENIYAPWETMKPLFSRAVIMTDGAGQRLGWDILLLNEENASSFEAQCQHFASETVRVMRENRLGQHYLAVVVNGSTVSRSDILVQQFISKCDEISKTSRLDIRVLLGFMAYRHYVPVVLTYA